ncbi:MAG: hypothetical protein WBE37_24650 [Bryobacteraceae bacterium]
MKNAFLFASVAALLPAMLAFGQVKSAGAGIVPVSFPAQHYTYSPDDIKVLGVLDNGETSKPAEFLSTPKYQAYVFEGNGHDQVEITVTGSSRKAYVALADSALTPIASGLGQLAVTLPYHGPDTEAFYILVKNLGGHPARLVVHLEKAAAIPTQTSLTTR